MTLGEERVRLTFNASANPTVTEIKQYTAALINLCEKYKQVGMESAPRSVEAQRLWALAQTAYEQAAMWAVKAVTT
jgi:hypothetical protein